MGRALELVENVDSQAREWMNLLNFVVLYCNFRSLAFLGLFGFLIRQLKV